ncbi:hypothetical protein F4553_005970 [Allocatelliglobosispora scoriae]|uniref:Uncharacterized protein n=1 Tax=Allocatelliglobosispora scoriae TaxID=643052 RepID=A0A841BYA8_9ACTN|nr:hypothetical protein [Allocatelliglobosispora scoriae]MBB5872536.1 hypothetical protein [Allocatelliglobosispora scoriae]
MIMMIRPEVIEFCRLGPLPSELDNSEGSDEALEEIEEALHAIGKPVTNEEAHVLLASFGEDNCFGLAWTLLHLVESSPDSAVTEEPQPGENMWMFRLWKRYRNSLDG